LNPARLGNDLWRERAILLRFALREVSQRYRGARLGVAWMFLQPLFLLAVYTVAFSLIMKLRWPESQRPGWGEVAMAVYCGLTAFGVLSECASRAPMLLVENQSYVKRARFPLQLLPVCVVLSASFHALANLAVLTLLGWIRDGFYAPSLLAPLFLTPLILVSWGVALLLAVLGPMLRDLRQFVPPILLAISFLTPVVYSPRLVPARLQWLVLGNPLAFTITSIRGLVLWRGAADWAGLGVWSLIGAAFLVGANAIFMRLKYDVTDLV
jgi:lipopolysaccharide transport system permease protein